MPGMNPAAALSHRALLTLSRWSYKRSANPHTTAYWRLKRSFLGKVLADPSLLTAFLNGAVLPAGYGLGFDERVVEYPWLFSRLPRDNGLMLDAGSVLNHPELLSHPRLDPKHLHIVTLAPESHCDWTLGVSYLFHDLRDLPFRDGVYETVVSLSTIEHIGMDNQRYAGSDRQRRHPTTISLWRFANCGACLRPVEPATSPCPTASTRTSAGIVRSTRRA